jgi:hypothetical protein
MMKNMLLLSFIAVASARRTSSPCFPTRPDHIHQGKHFGTYHIFPNSSLLGRLSSDRIHLTCSVVVYLLFPTGWGVDMPNVEAEEENHKEVKQVKRVIVKNGPQEKPHRLWGVTSVKEVEDMMGLE